MISHFVVARGRCLGPRVLPHAIALTFLKKVWHYVSGVTRLWYTLDNESVI